MNLDNVFSVLRIPISVIPKLFFEKVVGMILAYVIVRKLVLIVAEEDQYRKKKHSFPLPSWGGWTGSIWEFSSLVIVLYWCVKLIPDGPIAEWIQEAMGRIDQHPIVGSLLAIILPYMSTIGDAVLNYREFYLMLLALCVVEFLAHERIRKKFLDWILSRRCVKRISEIIKGTNTGAENTEGKKKDSEKRETAAAEDKETEGADAEAERGEKATATKKEDSEKRETAAAEDKETGDANAEAERGEKATATKKEDSKKRETDGAENGETEDTDAQVEKVAENKRNKLYEYDDKLGRCFLKEENKWQRVFYQFAFVAVLLINVLKGTNKLLMLFPLFAITEFWMQSAVPTRKEFFEDIQKQDGSNEREDRFNTAVRALKSKKSEQSGAEDEGFAKRFVPMKNDGVRGEWRPVDASAEPTHEEQLIERYLEICAGEGREVDPMLAYPAKAILNGKSVVFSTRFYQDVDYGFCLPMLRVLQSGYRCLVIADDKLDMKPVEDWLLSVRRQMTGNMAIWQMRKISFDDDQSQMDIGYITAEELGNARLMETNSAFLSEVRLVLIINASTLLHKQLFGIMRLRKRLHQKCAFVICNDNAVGLTDIYSHLLQTELSLVYPSTGAARQSTFAFFDEEESESDVLACRQIKVAKTLLQEEVGAVEKVRWYSMQATPVKDIANQYGMRLSADEAASPEEQLGKLVVGVHDVNCPREDFAYVIVEDEIHNPAELCVQFASRGKIGALVAVFSPKYRFRDYIRENFFKFYENTRIIAQTFPAYCMSERNAILQMMWNMERERLDEDDIRDICRLLGQAELEKTLWPQGHIEYQRLADKFKKYSGVANIEYFLHREHKLKGNNVRYEFWLDPISDENYDRKMPCRYVCAAFGPERRPLKQYSKIELAQCYVPGQIVPLDGQCYEITSIRESGDAVEMLVQKSAQTLRLWTAYLQKRRITIQNSEEDADSPEWRYIFPDIAESPGQELVLKRQNAEMLQVTTEGYWTLSENEQSSLKLLNKKQKEEFSHQFFHKTVLRVVLSGAEDAQDRSEIIRELMLELSELFRTIYAEYENQLLVCRQINEPAEGQPIVAENFLGDELKEDEAEYGCFYIVEDSEEDIGLLDSICLHFDRLLRIILEAQTNKREEGGNG